MTTQTTGLTVLTNSFHESEYRTRFSREELGAMVGREAQGYAADSERALLRKVRKALCGIEGCTCDTTGWGERS